MAKPRIRVSRRLMNRLNGVLLLLVVAVLTPLCRAIHFTNPDWNTAAPGKLLHLTWTDQVKWATIKLMRGRPEASEKGSDELVISNTPELEYYWRVPDDKPDGNYFLAIYDLSGNTGFSPVFQLQLLAETSTAAGPGSLTSSRLPTATASTRDSTPTSQPTDTLSSSEITGGAKAGIAIGAIIGIITLLGGVSYIFYHRGKQVGASRREDENETGSPPWGGWIRGQRRARNRLHSSDGGSDLEGTGGGSDKFMRSPTPTPKELSGEEKLPSELGSEVLPMEIGTDWPVVAELCAGQLCVEEMEMERDCECGEIKLSRDLDMFNPGDDKGEPEERGRATRPVAEVSPLTPGPADNESSGNEEYLKDHGVGDEKRDTLKTVEIQIQLKDDR